jgi:hypothetical protein
MSMVSRVTPVPGYSNVRPSRETSYKQNIRVILRRKDQRINQGVHALMLRRRADEKRRRWRVPLGVMGDAGGSDMGEMGDMGAV